jgi:hypothetical protein
MGYKNKDWEAFSSQRFDMVENAKVTNALNFLEELLKEFIPEESFSRNDINRALGYKSLPNQIAWLCEKNIISFDQTLGLYTINVSSSAVSRSLGCPDLFYTDNDNDSLKLYDERFLTGGSW